jgi:hypothetical protein
MQKFFEKGPYGIRIRSHLYKMMIGINGMYCRFSFVNIQFVIWDDQRESLQE